MPVDTMPPRAEWPRLRPTLETGEEALLGFLADRLEPPWEVYAQCYLNGEPADVVALHPEHGLTVFEVKDWSDPGDFFVRTGNYGGGVLYRSTAQGVISARNPVHQAMGYRDTIVHRLSDLIASHGETVAHQIARPAVFISTWTTAEASGLLGRFRPTNTPRELLPILGGDLLTRGDVSWCLPVDGYAFHADAARAFYEQIRPHLQEPSSRSEQREALPLSDRQRDLATTRTATGYRRIKGPAGSGKSSVLAARAAELSAAGQRVLVVSHNITLWHYLRDLVVRHRRSATSDPMANLRRITFLHFHAWCDLVCEEAGRSEDLARLLRRYDDYPETEVIELVQDCLNAPGPYDPSVDSGVGMFDAVIVDEGQDIAPDGWAQLRRVVRDEGEWLFAADKTQGLYKTQEKWTDGVMTAAGFSGDWSRLNISHRLPSALVDPLADFTDRFLDDLEVDPPVADPQQGLFDCTITWNNVDEMALIDSVVGAVREAVTEHGVHPGDIAFLVESHGVGEACTQRLEAENIEVRHVFGSNRNSRRRKKIAFYKGAGNVLGSTVHSFKGWESRFVVLGIGSGWAAGSGDSPPRDHLVAVYVGLSRVKAHADRSWLTVLNCDRSLDDFGSRWFGRQRSGQAVPF